MEKSAAEELVVREAREEDGKVICAMLQELDQAYGDLTESDLRQQERLWQEAFQDKRQRILAAELKGQIVGTLTLFIMPNLGHGGQPWAAVDNVIVDPSFRGSGIGTALMSRAGKIAGENRCYKIVLTSNLAREKAHEFYRGLGWQQTHLGFSLALEKA